MFINIWRLIFVLFYFLKKRRRKNWRYNSKMYSSITWDHFWLLGRPFAVDLTNYLGIRGLALAAPPKQGKDNWQPWHVNHGKHPRCRRASPHNASIPFANILLKKTLYPPLMRLPPNSLVSFWVFFNVMLTYN